MVALQASLDSLPDINSYIGQLDGLADIYAGLPSPKRRLVDDTVAEVQSIVDDVSSVSLQYVCVRWR